MTQKEFDDGFKLLKRFLKENHIYNDFLKITAPNRVQYKKDLFFSFNHFEYFRDWNHFFRFTHGVGMNYHMYGHNKIGEFNTKWKEFMIEHRFNGLKYY